MGNTSREQSSNILNGVVLAQNSVSEKKMTLQDVLAEYAGLGIVVSLVIIFVLLLLVYSLSVSRKKQMEALKEAQNANAANIAKTTFLNHMSHDIRTPMNAIVGFTDIAMKRKPDKEVENCLKKIRQSSEYLMTLVNDVLDISRIESGKLEYKPVLVDLRDMTDTVLSIARGYMENRDLHFYVSREELKNPYVMADELRIREVLLNIISNAVKFTKDGGTISFVAENCPGKDEHHLIVRYHISDTGIGMSEEFQTRIFDEFSQENNGARTSYKGTGLGMAIGLVQGMQANMDVLGSLVTGQDAQIQAINQSLKNIEADLKQLQNSKGQVDTNVNTLRAQIREQIQICNKQLNNLMNDYNNNVRPSFRNTGKSMQQAFLNAAAMMNGTDVNMDEISDILGEYEQTIREGNLSLQDSLTIAQELLDKVSKIADNIKRITGADSYEDILKAMASDPTSVAEFVSSPVKLQTVPVYPVEHYGSAASPFYTILAIWVGALFLVAIIHVGVKPIDPGDHYKEYERYFGRYLLFFLIGQAQTLLTILGNLYYIEIQCQHKFLYWLAAAVASAAFSCFMYSVTFAFGNVGEALAIVVMVIQVAGSGGTFPIEALPKVFQWIYPFLPFQFGMKAFKECIAGMYGVDYWINVGKMVLFLIIALLLGLALEPPFRKLNHRIEKSKEKTGLMI